MKLINPFIIDANIHFSKVVVSNIRREYNYAFIEKDFSTNAKRLLYMHYFT